MHQGGRLREVKEKDHFMSFPLAKFQLLFQSKFQNVLQNNLKPDAFSRGDFSTRFAAVAAGFWICKSADYVSPESSGVFAMKFYHSLMCR